MDLNQVHLW